MLWRSVIFVVTFLSATIHTARLKNKLDSKKISYRIASKTVDGIECVTDCINNVCYTDVYRRDTAPCSPGTEPAPQYRTAQRKQASPDCTSRCGTYGYSYEWCYTGDTIDDKSWDYCSARIAEYEHIEYKHVTKHGIYCATACDHHGYKYTWCYTVDGSWGKCDKSHVKPYVQTYTYRRMLCAGVCHVQERYKYNWCYTRTKSWAWDYCAPPARTRSLINVMYKSTCNILVTNSSHVASESSDSTLSNSCPGFLDGRWNRLLQLYRMFPGEYKVVTVRDEPGNPIRDYVLHVDDGSLTPLGVRAVINNATVDARHCHVASTVGLLATCNGHPTTVLALLPQDSCVLRGRRPPHHPRRHYEIDVDRFVRNTTNYILENVIVQYNTTTRPPSPTALIFTQSYRYANGDIVSESICYIPKQH